jgi:hypothetical protein
MSLFEHSSFQYRETCFVLFPKENRPKLNSVTEAIESLGDRYKLGESESNDEGYLESISVFCPNDHAALDISYLDGEDVSEHLEELSEEFPSDSLEQSEREKWNKAQSFSARIDLFHFEEVSSEMEPDEGLLDPGAMLVILQTIANLTGGVGVDPSAGTVV